jgi:hypothetical protein
VHFVDPDRYFLGGYGIGTEVRVSPSYADVYRRGQGCGIPGHQARLDAIHREGNEEVQAAMRFAEESPEPAAAALYEDRFAENPEERVRNGSESAN